MNESQLIQLIRRTVEQALPPILVGLVLSNESASRSTVRRFSNEGPRGNVRSVLPYGFASKAPANTQALIVPGGQDQTNLNMVGHFDEARPPHNDGETVLYNQFGRVIYLSANGIHIGGEGATENNVLGKVFQAMMVKVLDAIAQHTHAAPGAPPSNAALFTAIKQSPVSDGAVLSDISFVQKG